MGVRTSRNCKTPSPSPDKTRCLSGGVSTLPPSTVLGSDSFTCPPCLPAFMLEEDNEGLGFQELAGQMAAGRASQAQMETQPAGVESCRPQGAESRHGTHILGPQGCGE